ncbi:MAG: DNA polymerase III subunit delta [Patescibacteria group bacterium]
MLYFLFGPDTFRAKQYIDQTINQLKKTDPDIAVQKLDGTTILPQPLAENLEPLALFTSRKITIIKNLFTTKNQVKAQEIMINYLDHPDPNNIIIIWEQDNFDKRSQIYRKIKKMIGANCNIEEFNLLKKPALINWTKNYCRERQINIDHQAINILVDRAPTTFALVNEITKATTHSPDKITAHTIDELTPPIPTEIIFDLTDQIGHKKNSLAYQTAINLTHRGEDPLKIIASLATHLQNLIAVKELNNQHINPSDIHQQTNIHPFVIKKCLEQTRHFSLPELVQIHHRLAQTDYRLKTGQSDFPTEIFKVITN